MKTHANSPAHLFAGIHLTETAKASTGPIETPKPIHPDPEHMRSMCTTLGSLGMPLPMDVSQVDPNQALDYLVGAPVQSETTPSQAACIRALVQWGGDINGIDGEGQTLLMRAIASSSPHLNLLVELGAKADAVDLLGRNAWHHIAIHGATNVDKLAAADARHTAIHAPDHNHRTPLWHACQQPEVAKGMPVLLQCGADISRQDQEGCNAWFYAARSPCAATLLPLMAFHDKTGLAINTPNRRGERAIEHLPDNPAYSAFVQSFGGVVHTGVERAITKLQTFASAVNKNLASAIDAYAQENEKTLSQLARACATSNDSANYVQYGSDAGNQYFQAYRKRVVVPALADCFSYLQSALPTFTEQYRSVADATAIAIFQVVANQLGDMRRHIADVSRSTNAQEFGQRIFVSSLVDPVDAFSGWRSRMGEHFRALLTDAFHAIEGSRTPENLVRSLVKLKCGVVKDIVEDEQRLSFSILSPSGPLSGLFVGHFSLKPKDLATLVESDIEGLFSPTPANTPDDQGSHLLIDCHHEAMEVQHLLNLSQSFVQALTWNKERQDTVELKRSVHAFLGQLHATSLWHRGQAAGAQMLVDAIGELHGMDIVVPADWQSDPQRQNVVIDQRFLSDFDDQETSFQKFDAMVQFVPRPLPPDSDD